jgi:hypothetical protein
MLAMPPKLIEAVPGEGYEVRLRFADGLTADVDLSYLLEYGGVFRPLRGVEYFRRLRVDDGGNTIAWPNEADIAPETLYGHVQRADYEKRRAAAAL